VHTDVRFANGYIEGLVEAKNLFKKSTDARGGCKIVSKGSDCECCLCLIDNEIARVIEMVKQEQASENIVG
jgi:hypothetical protein